MPKPAQVRPRKSNDPAAELAFAREVLRDEAAALSHLGDALGEDLTKAVDLIVKCADAGGTVLVTGLGKSGLVGAKISATLASLGIPSHSVHPSEAAHGDLGRFRATDSVIAISFSGETDEVVNLAAILRQDGVPIVSITGGEGRHKGTEARRDGGEEKQSTLERLATVSLRLGVTEEAGEGFVAPTTSTTATLALGDALALCAARRRNFTSEDFAKRHPGGSLGELLRPVTDILRFVAGKNLPLISQSRSVAEALREANAAGRRPGAILLVDDRTGALAGIFTDGDLRRLVLRDAKELTRPIAEVMTKNPRTLPSTAQVRDAVRVVREFRADEMPVVDDAGRPVGILDVQDLVAMRLIKD